MSSVSLPIPIPIPLDKNRSASSSLLSVIRSRPYAAADAGSGWVREEDAKWAVVTVASEEEWDCVRARLGGGG